MILLIDNYDSFVHNLARYVRERGEDAMVRRNDEISVSDVEQRWRGPEVAAFVPPPVELVR